LTGRSSSADTQDGPTIGTVATRAIHLQQASYELLQREASRRGIKPDELADVLVRTDLAGEHGDLLSALAGLAELRRRLPRIDGVALAHGARAELDRCGA
jgi:hypothetical protein